MKAALLGVNSRAQRCGWDDLAELASLAAAAGLDISWAMLLRQERLQPATMIGKGKLARVGNLVREAQVRTLVTSCPASGGQLRRLRAALKIDIIDRTGLILNIFAQRATSAQGKLQVELARSEYEYAQLVSGWQHLERQRGKTGTVGGPGEKQLEIDRRLLMDRIRRLRERIGKHHQRAMRTVQRRRRSIATVALVGYTNAGKSSLFARLAGQSVPASERMFETLDTTTRRVYLGEGSYAAISDTVGFVRDLPHTLVDAFRATLREAVDADLLLLVVDTSDPHCWEKARVVEDTLEEIGAGQVPRLLVGNKSDLLPEGRQWSGRFSGCDKIVARVSVSAFTGRGVPELRRQLCSQIGSS